MNREIKRVFSPPSPQEFEKYLFYKTSPPLDINALSLSLAFGDERRDLKIPSAGDWSLVLSYKDKEAYLASFAEERNNGDLVLHLMQLQGAHTKRGYRVATGMDTLLFITDQIEKIISHPENPYAFLTMPPVALINGIIDATETAILAYERAARRLKMVLSQEEKCLIRGLRQ